MNLRPLGSIFLVGSVVAAFALQPMPAGAANLLDMLFGGGLKKTQRVEGPAGGVERRQGRAQKRSKARAVRRIEGPEYYTYTADPLVRVDFSPVTDSPVPAALSSATGFDDLLPALATVDLFAEKDLAAGLTQFYAANRTLLWVDKGAASARAAEARAVLAEADRYGLSPEDYIVAEPGPRASPQDLMRFEMTLSARVLRYVQDATTGRIDPNRISGYHDLPRKPVDGTAVLSALSQMQDVRTFLDSRHPQNAEYGALSAELAALRARDDDTIAIDPSLLLKPGQSSDELPKVLATIARDLDDELGGEFGEVLWANARTKLYGPDLVPAIKAVQTRKGLKADGVIGPRTVAALAGKPVADRIERLELALEQLRWLPSDLGSPRVFVNQPAFVASYIDGGVEKLSMRVVVGAPSTQTSFFYDEIEQVDYNPYWGVPQSILVNEMLPRLRRDPGYLDRAGYEVTDAKGRRIRSSSIPWGRYGSSIPYDVRQTPSEANALGELKILFPNKHAIYMHDTPSKSLFQRDSRALSHGCIRLHDPRGMAAAVLGKSVDYVAGKLAEGHSSEKVARKIPVYIAYFTAWPSPSGRVEYFDDVYGRDAHLEMAIRATESVRVPRG